MNSTRCVRKLTRTDGVSLSTFARSDLSTKIKAARLVAQKKGTAGVYYDETFSPVEKRTYIRTLLAVASAKQWPLFSFS